MNARYVSVLWAAQRASAGVLALFVLVHLATMIYAVQGGLSADEILGRTRGNVAWMVFYTLFVLATVVHVPIGLRNITAEHFGWRGGWLEAFTVAVGVVLLVMGLQAVWAVFA